MQPVNSSQLIVPTKKKNRSYEDWGVYICVISISVYASENKQDENVYRRRKCIIQSFSEACNGIPLLN